MDDRVERERSFHDDRFGDEEHRSADRFYDINEASDQFFRDAIDRIPAPSRLLDYGCGEGAYAALHAARSGHEVVAIDISPVAIEHARERAEEDGVADRIEFKVMNAEALDLKDDSFDAVIGLGVIHHLEIAAAMREVARVLKPSGHAVFVEPLGHNPAINLFRRRTPEQRSADEHPIVMADLAVIRRYFSELDAAYFHLFGLLAIPLRGRRGFDRSLRFLDSVDRRVFRRVKVARRHAWMIGLRLASPKPST